MQIRIFIAENRIKYQIQKGSGPIVGKYTDIRAALRVVEQVLPSAAYVLRILVAKQDHLEEEYDPSGNLEIPEFRQEEDLIQMRFILNGKSWKAPYMKFTYV